MKVSKVTGYLLCGMILAAGILFFVENNALAEDVTITTYYPAPYGVYKNLTSTEDTYLATVSGNVGIGTTSPVSYKLYVNGNMYVNGDITTDSDTYPDYVFESGYELLALKELKKFIKEKKHLPGMPSAKKAKEDGIKIFEQNRLILEKLEEAYLYIIELQERIEKLEAYATPER